MKLLTNGPKSSKKVFIFAHGAGAPMDSDWMNDLVEQIVEHKIKVVRFEFPYMADRRSTGTKKPPNPEKKLLEHWKKVIAKVGNPSKVFIGGKSMGGRMASLIADECGVKGLIVTGFPFHAPGKTPGNRIDHLKKLKTPTLIVQGTRDSMGTKQEVSKYKLSSKIKYVWMEDGDHSLKPRKASGNTLEEYMADAASKIAKFIGK